MGLRAVTEEPYPRNTGIMCVAGTFDMMQTVTTSKETLTCELPNCADLLSARIELDGEALDLSKGDYSSYLRVLDLYSGLLKRSFTYRTCEGKDIDFEFERFVSLHDKHLAGQRIRICPQAEPVKITISTGIGIERYGEMHFVITSSRHQECRMQYSETTKQSGIEFIYTAGINISAPDKIGVVKTIRESDEGIYFMYDLTIPAGCEIVVEKVFRVATTRDLENTGIPPEELRAREWQKLGDAENRGFDRCFSDSAGAWAKLWELCDVRIDSEDSFDQLALRFAVYHLTAAAPVHDSRMSIGAKGLADTRYSGHTYWETEIYMLPYFVHTAPHSARSLLKYRYLCLDAARQKARAYGYSGAMYPWSAAWIDDVECHPDHKYAKYEHHITADVSYGVHYYYEATGDLDFMLRFGCEILFETAAYWRSRLEFNNEKQRYEITKVIGPDEYTLYVDNNAFTNYMAHFNLKLAIRWYDRLQAEHPLAFKALNEKLKLEEEYPTWSRRADMLYLPAPTPEGILPQDDTYMTLEEVDLTAYRAALRPVRSDYPYPVYSKLKVSKQADIMVLFLLLEDLFSREVKSRSFHYYEPFCVHESSLSLCSYSMLAADVGIADEAYELYRRACRIDLGTKMNSCDDGIHVASLGGVWQCTVFGFLGVRLYADGLRIAPNLPEKWHEVSAKIWWRGQLLAITADHKRLTVEVLSGSDTVTLLTPPGIVTVSKKLILDYAEVGVCAKSKALSSISTAL
jgi:hypothetical glycosyl hydrolase